MLMNFSIGDEPWSVKPVIKGGNWRDRARTRKLLKKSSRGQSTDAETGTGANTEQVSERPAKRQKTSGLNADFTSKSKSDQPREVVSSLFNNNPESITTTKQATQGDIAPVEPSNAPLLEGLDTFTSLGLISSLAAHLLTKLELKAPTAIQKTAIAKLLEENTDAFIQAETGSGKTLAYLLPILQRLMEMSDKLKKINGDQEKLMHRDSGLFAIIIAPTRELCKQISVVLDSLLGCARWIVSGTVFGGEKKKSEKARLRKGINVLVATPGRLVDHLEHTKVLDVSNVRWLILDEGDRLMELGFEDDIRTIVKTLEQQSGGRQKHIPGLPPKRTTILCSATMKMNVQKLGEMSLKDAVHIKNDSSDPKNKSERDSPDKSPEFSAPAQLQQSYIIVPPKQRLVTLFGLLKRTFARKGSVMKAIVFLSCADSVDFHFSVLTRSTSPSSRDSSPEPDISSPTSQPSPPTTTSTVAPAPLLTTTSNPGLTIHKTHGSLSQPLRSSTLHSFTKTSHPSILLCTDVASRGLDLPSIDLVIEFDPAFSRDDHIHRIGRTARAGKPGRATIFLMPGPEERYIDVLKGSFTSSESVSGQGRVRREVGEDVLKKAFAPIPTTPIEGGKKSRKNEKSGQGLGWEDAATEWQLDTERWVGSDAKAAAMARKAYVSHVRAYATHILAERHVFDVKGLHLGHLAKGFGLRERPGAMGRGVTGGGSGKGGKERRGIGGRGGREGGEDSDVEAAKGNVVDRSEAARKMRAAMRGHVGASEFNIG